MTFTSPESWLTALEDKAYGKTGFGLRFSFRTIARILAQGYRMKQPFQNERFPGRRAMFVAWALMGTIFLLANSAFSQSYEGQISDFDSFTKTLKVSVSGEDMAFKVNEFSDLELETPGSRDKLAEGKFVEATGSLSADRTQFDAKSVVIHPIFKSLKPAVGKDTARGVLKGSAGQWTVDVNGKSVALTIPDDAPVTVDTPALEYDLRKGRNVSLLVAGRGEAQYIKSLKIHQESAGAGAPQVSAEEKAAPAPEATPSARTGESAGGAASQEYDSPLWQQRKTLAAAAGKKKAGAADRLFTGPIMAADPSSRTWLIKTLQGEFLLRIGYDAHIYNLRPATASDLVAGRMVEVSGKASEAGDRVAALELRILMTDKDSESLFRRDHVAGVLQKDADGLAVKTADRVVRIDLSPKAVIEQIVPTTVGSIKLGDKVRVWGRGYGSEIETAGLMTGAPRGKNETYDTVAPSAAPGTGSSSETPAPARKGAKGYGKTKTTPEEKQTDEGFIIK
jgi:hypothetical protein